eukprot:GAHX01000241.1.p1 GENE.GAHX01000241.1~~GAHX01000241.1.p1  ORF type:complete len:196 (+),score=26.19 GAHX01000241.1:38-625(+)
MTNFGRRYLRALMPILVVMTLCSLTTTASNACNSKLIGKRPRDDSLSASSNKESDTGIPRSKRPKPIVFPPEINNHADANDNETNANDNKIGNRDSAHSLYVHQEYISTPDTDKTVDLKTNLPSKATNASDKVIGMEHFKSLAAVIIILACTAMMEVLLAIYLVRKYYKVKYSNRDENKKVRKLKKARNSDIVKI